MNNFSPPAAQAHVLQHRAALKARTNPLDQQRQAYLKMPRLRAAAYRRSSSSAPLAPVSVTVPRTTAATLKVVSRSSVSSSGAPGEMCIMLVMAAASVVTGK